MQRGEGSDVIHIIPHNPVGYIMFVKCFCSSAQLRAEILYSMCDQLDGNQFWRCFKIL